MNAPKRNTVIDRTDEWRGKLSAVGDHDVTYETIITRSELTTCPESRSFACGVANIIEKQTGISGVRSSLPKGFAPAPRLVIQALKKLGCVNITLESKGGDLHIRFKKIEKKS
jgi:hypothetical protein